MKKDVEKAKFSLENKIRILQSGGHITKLTAEESLVLKMQYDRCSRIKNN